MQSSNGKLSVEELVYSYNGKGNCKTNIKIYEGGYSKCSIIKSVCGSRGTHKVVFDPNKTLRIGQYSDSYYCNTWKELIEIVDYLFNESLLNDEENSEDILDLKETKRYFFLDDEINNI